MSNLRFDLEQEVRNFLRSEINNGTLKRVIYDPETLAVIGLSDTAKAYDFGQDCAISDFLRLPSRFVDGRVVDLKDDLLDALSGHAQGKCVKPAKLAAQILDGLKHVLVMKFIDEFLTDVEGREQRLRARMHAFGCKVVKARVRNPRSPRYGTYDIELEATGEIIIEAPQSLTGLERWSPSEPIPSHDR